MLLYGSEHCAFKFNLNAKTRRIKIIFFFILYGQIVASLNLSSGVKKASLEWLLKVNIKFHFHTEYIYGAILAVNLVTDDGVNLKGGFIII